MIKREPSHFVSSRVDCNLAGRERIEMQLQERQIRKRLEEDFEPLIDMTDVAQHSADEQAKARTSRALAALTVTANAKISVEQSCKSVVDESNDNGLDAIGISLARGEVYIVQAKTAAGSPSPTEVMKFANGIRLFLDCDWNRLGDKAKKRRSEFEEALESVTKVVAIFSHLGSQGPNEAAKQVSDQLQRDVNAAGDILDFRYEGLRENFDHRNIASGLGAPDYEFAFERWVTMTDYRSELMGIVAGEQLANLVELFNERLFDKNIRSILRQTETNEVLDDTLRNSPSDFWYYNNGITIVANSISCRRSNPRSTNEVFSLKGLSVVNGAQTCGALARSLRNGIPLDDVRVTVRVISTEAHSENFEQQVTRYTNTQNQVSNREFVSLDTFQQELSDILVAEGIQYSFRTGQSLDADEYSFAFDLEEATRALACLTGEGNATRAKREIGRMWSDLSSGPYLDIFPRTLDAATMYNAVRFWRTVNSMMDSIAKDWESRSQNIVKNSVYVACALLMQYARSNAAQFSDIDWDVEAWLAQEKAKVEDLANLIVELHEEANTGGFAMSFFKNQQKVEVFAVNVRKRFMKRAS